MATTPLPYFMLFYVSDLEASLKYFTQTLGFVHDPRQDTLDFRGFITSVGSPAYGLALVSKSTSPVEGRHPGAIEIYYKTDNLEEMHVALTSKGVKVTEIVQRPFGTIFTAPSPDGHLVTMIRPFVR